jgi:O-acetyl-ADP-ribose deacetylase (regulator of RNase III)
MLHFLQGNLLEASAEALVNTVNEVGVMGKGIALMFQEAFPESSRAYKEACKRGEVRVGRVLMTPSQRSSGPRWIVHFPTKKHWRNPSRLQWVRDGLQDLVQQIRVCHIASIAVPPLGCGNGGLDWEQVRIEIELAFADLPDVEILVFAPAPHSLNTQKRQGVEALTPARALVAELVRRYSVLGIECALLEIQKLAWFLHRVILAQGLEDPLRLQFVAHRYGPYDDGLRHLLNDLDGSYLHCSRRIADASPLDPVWFDEGKRDRVATFLHEPTACRYLPALDRTAAVVDGFESPLGMELLATVDWLLCREHIAPTVAAMLEGIRRWPGGSESGLRKHRLFDARMVDLALRRLLLEQPIDGARN